LLANRGRRKPRPRPPMDGGRGGQTRRTRLRVRANRLGGRVRLVRAGEPSRNGGELRRRDRHAGRQAVCAARARAEVALRPRRDRL